MPERLFPVPTLSINGSTFDVSPDGERLLFVLPVPNARPTTHALHADPQLGAAAGAGTMIGTRLGSCEATAVSHPVLAAIP